MLHVIWLVSSGESLSVLFAVRLADVPSRIARESLNIRYSLLPFLYTLFYQHFTQETTCYFFWFPWFSTINNPKVKGRVTWSYDFIKLPVPDGMVWVKKSYAAFLLIRHVNKTGRDSCARTLARVPTWQHNVDYRQTKWRTKNNQRYLYFINLEGREGGSRGFELLGVLLLWKNILRWNSWTAF